MHRKLPKYCHHRPTNQAYVTLPLGKGKRKMIYLGVFNSRDSLAKYDKVVGEWLATKEAPADDDVLKVRDVAERFTSHQESILNQDKMYNVGNAMKLLVELYGTRPASEFDGLLFEQYRTRLIDDNRSRSYSKRLLRIVRECFKWALKYRHIASDQYTSICTVDPLTSKEAPTKVVEPANDGDVDATMPLLSADFQDMIRFLRATGCRPGEARLLQVGDVDRENWLFKPAKHKTSHRGKSRVIPIPSSARALLLPRLLRPADAYVFGADDGERAYHKRALARAIDRAIVRINHERSDADLPPMDHWHPYQLRHARATEVREQYGVEVAQVILGHSRIDMTQHYAGVTEAKAKEVGKLIG